MDQANYSKISFALFIAFLAVIISHPIHAQVGIGTTTPDASAVLDIQSSSNDKGILIPRMTTHEIVLRIKLGDGDDGEKQGPESTEE